MPPNLDEEQIRLASRFVLDCLGCHSIQPGAPELAAPSLWNVYERSIGSSKYFAGYSAALANRPGIWDEEALNNFLRDSEGFAPGNDMDYPPISDERMRRAVINFLHSLRSVEEQDSQTESWQSRIQRLIDVVMKKLVHD